MIIDTLRVNSNLFSLGSLLGGNSQQMLLNNLESTTGGRSYFGSEADPMREGYQTYMTHIVEPIRQSAEELKAIAVGYECFDEYREISSMDELMRGVPPCMRMGIVTYEPLRDMFNEGRIDGFGFKPEELPINDPFENACESGKIRYTADDIKDNKIDVEYKRDSDDRELTPEQALALSSTRDYIDEFMDNPKTRHLDFTDPTSLHG